METLPLDEIEEIMDESENYDGIPGNWPSDIRPENLVSYLCELCHTYNPGRKTFVDVRAYIPGCLTYSLALLKDGAGCLGDYRERPLIIKRLEGVDSQETAAQWVRDLRSAFREHSQTIKVHDTYVDDESRSICFYIEVK